MREISDRFGERCHAGLAARVGFDEDIRPGELACAIARAQAGDREAMGYLYLRFAGNVYGYAKSIVLDAGEAEDVTQQVFARVLSAIGSYEPRGIPFSAWLLRIAHNASIDQIRRRRSVPSDLSWARGGRDGEDAGITMEVRAAISELPRAQREVVVLRHIAGWSPPEIARYLDKSQQAIHGLHHRGRRALQQGLVQRETVPATV